VLDDVDDEVVRDEAARVHDLLRLNTKGRLGLHLRTEDVTSREVAYAELVADFRSLSTLACCSLLAIYSKECT
jgi:hypothetical protein